MGQCCFVPPHPKRSLQFEHNFISLVKPFLAMLCKTLGRLDNLKTGAMLGLRSRLCRFTVSLITWLRRTSFDGSLFAINFRYFCLCSFFYPPNTCQGNDLFLYFCWLLSRLSLEPFFCLVVCALGSIGSNCDHFIYMFIDRYNARYCARSLMGVLNSK